MADIDRIAEVLQDATETHHTVYAITEGDDPDWASGTRQPAYARRLADHFGGK